MSSPAVSIPTVGPHAAFCSIDVEGNFPEGGGGVKRPGFGAYNVSPSVRDIRLPPQSRYLRFSGLFTQSVLTNIDVSGQLIGPIFRGQEAK